MTRRTSIATIESGKGIGIDHNGNGTHTAHNTHNGYTNGVHETQQPIKPQRIRRKRRVRIIAPLQWIYSRTRRLVLIVLRKVLSKEYLSRNLWIIRCAVLLILCVSSILTYYLLLRNVMKSIVWIYEHSECYTREGSIHWEEGRSHTMKRTCPPITQYITATATSGGEGRLMNIIEQPQQHQHQPPLPPRYEPSKICITTLSDALHRQQTKSILSSFIQCRNFDDVFKRTLPNHIQYGMKHGYQVYDLSYLLDTSRPPAWSKIRAVQELFQSKYNCDWIVWFDADIVIMNSSITIESILPDLTLYNTNTNNNINNENDIDLIVTPDRRFTANSGAWMIRNSLWSQQFLQNWWNLKSFVRPSGLSLSGDNDAFGYLIRQYMKVDDDTTKARKEQQHIQIIPRCIMNSFGVFVPSSSTKSSFAIRKRESVLKLGNNNNNQKQLDDAADVTNEEWYLHSDQWYYSGDFIAHASGIDQKDIAVQLLLARAE